MHVWFSDIYVLSIEFASERVNFECYNTQDIRNPEYSNVEKNFARFM